jgi:hypothetical protein
LLKPNKLLPDEVRSYWPEIFDEVSLNVVPFHYIYSVIINFKDTKSWEIKVTKQIKKDGWMLFQTQLDELLDQYEHKIEDVDIKLDAVRVRKDIEKLTKNFLKKRKL